MFTDTSTEAEARVATRCSTPYVSHTQNEDLEMPGTSSTSKKLVLGQLSFSAPSKSAVVKSTKKNRPGLGMMVN